MNSDFQNIVGQKYISTLKIIKSKNTLGHVSFISSLNTVSNT